MFWRCKQFVINCLEWGRRAVKVTNDFIVVAICSEKNQMRHFPLWLCHWWHKFKSPKRKKEKEKKASVYPPSTHRLSKSINLNLSPSDSLAFISLCFLVKAEAIWILIHPLILLYCWWFKTFTDIELTQLTWFLFTMEANCVLDKLNHFYRAASLKTTLSLLLVLKVASRALPQDHSGIFFSQIIYLAYYFFYTQYHPVRVITVYKTLTTQYKLA